MRGFGLGFSLVKFLPGNRTRRPAKERIRARQVSLRLMGAGLLASKLGAGLRHCGLGLLNLGGGLSQVCLGLLALDFKFARVQPGQHASRRDRLVFLDEDLFDRPGHTRAHGMDMRGNKSIVRLDPASSRIPPRVSAGANQKQGKQAGHPRELSHLASAWPLGNFGRGTRDRRPRAWNLYPRR